MMFNDTTASAGGEVTATIEKPKLTRAERVEAWRKEHEAAYKSACDHERCTCTPSRAEALLMSQWNNPPID